MIFGDLFNGRIIYKSFQFFLRSQYIAGMSRSRIWEVFWQILAAEAWECPNSLVASLSSVH